VTEGLCFIVFQDGGNVCGGAVFLNTGNRLLSSMMCASLLIIIRSSTLDRQLVKEIGLTLKLSTTAGFFLDLRIGNTIGSLHFFGNLPSVQ
jgi:hypothetical protein